MSMLITANVMDADLGELRKPAFKLLLMALADRADEAGVCWPSRADIVRRTGLSLSSLTRTARALEGAGWIQRRQRKDTSTVYRLNVVRLERSAKGARAELKARNVVKDWSPFAEEETAQALENIGEGQCDPGSGQSDPGSGQAGLRSGQSDPVTYQEPIKEPKGAARQNGDLEGDSDGRVNPQAVLSASRFAQSRIASGQSVMVAGVPVKPGSATMTAMQAVLRARVGRKAGVC